MCVGLSLLLRVINYPCCASCDTQHLARHSIVSKTKIHGKAGYQ